MKLECRNNGLFIFWDLDDVVVTSSPYLQKQVDEKTGFKTSTLKMLEQLKRNCEFSRDEVKKECSNAFEKKRLPHLDRFPFFSECDFNHKYPHFTFGRMTKEQYEDIYESPIKCCEYYIKVVDLLINQFLEERDAFLEKDNLSRGQIIKYDYQKEADNYKYFRELINNNKNALIQISGFCLTEIERISNKARDEQTKPNYGSLIKMDSNDIIRENDGSRSQEYFLYDKPVKDVCEVLITIESLDDITNNFWEYLNYSTEIINYDTIYTTDHVNWDAVRVVLALLECPFIAGQCVISHHNGQREERAKRNLVEKVLKDIPFIGMRFHDSEHIGVRRGRSSKFKEAVKYYFGEVSRMVLGDDSIANDRDWEDNGAKSILYRKPTNSELINNELEDTGFLRITNFDVDEIKEILSNYYESLIEKQKIK